MFYFQEIGGKLNVSIEKLRVVKDDPDDDMVIECEVEGNVDYIVSNDKHLLTLKKFGGVKIVTPLNF